MEVGVVSGRSCTRGVLIKRASSKSGTLGFNSCSIVPASDYSLPVSIYSILNTFSILFYVDGNAYITTCHEIASSLCHCYCPRANILRPPYFFTHALVLRTR